MIEVPLADFPRLLYPYNGTLVSCQGKTGSPNVLAIAWVMPASTVPPMLAFAVRQERHSYRLLEESKEFVVNIAGFDLASQVLFCGRRSGKDIDKFEATGLTPGKAKKVGVPIVSECVAHVECKVAEMIPKGDHVLVIGEVLAAYVRENAFGKKVYDLKRYKPLLYLGSDMFTTTSSETIEPKLGD
jgi:flavin reductase (DIM6/NTAB) family NADH-FMN oxidoreductase RutF